MSGRRETHARPAPAGRHRECNRHRCRGRPVRRRSAAHWAQPPPCRAAGRAAPRHRAGRAPAPRANAAVAGAGPGHLPDRSTPAHPRGRHIRAATGRGNAAGRAPRSCAWREWIRTDLKRQRNGAPRPWAPGRRNRRWRGGSWRTQGFTTMQSWPRAVSPAHRS